MGQVDHEPRRRRRIARAINRTIAGLFAIAVIVGAIGLRYWTDPTTVRQMVLERLRAQFPGAEVSLDSARLWPGWGIAVSNLTLSRRDDPTFAPVLQVPSGRIEHDPELLAQGKLRIRRLKAERARITAVRSADGKWNIDGLLAPPKPNTPLPIVVIERGTLVLRLTAPAGDESSWEVRELKAALVEQEPGRTRFEARGESQRLGPVVVEGSWGRRKGDVELTLDVAALPLNTALLQEAARFGAGNLESVRHCIGMVQLHLDAHNMPEEGHRWQTAWRFRLSQGKLGLRELPLDLEDLELYATLSQGKLDVRSVKARAADAPLRASLEARLPITSGDPMGAVDSLTVSTERLLVTPELFARLPEKVQKFHQKFAPVGRLNLSAAYVRRGGDWDARVEVQPENMAARYHKFPYPFRQVRGSLVSELSSRHPGRHHVDLSAEVNGGSRVAIRGGVAGEDPFPAVDLRVTGLDGKPVKDIPIDDELIAALPAKFQPIARSFHFRGVADIQGRIHHAAGQPNGHDQYHLHCRGATVCYDLFPVPLENVAAELAIHLGPGTADDPNRNDHWVLTNFSGQHEGGRVVVAAHDEAVATGRRTVIDFGGQRMPMSEPLAQALAKHRLASVWQILSPTGAMDFTARLVLTDRPGGRPDPAFTFETKGATIKPSFFPYLLSDFAAKLHYEAGKTLLGECSANHGKSRLRLSNGVVQTTAGLLVDVRDIQASPLIPDAELVQALPPTLQRACAALKPDGRFAVDVKRLVLHDPPAVPGPPGPPVLYWDGSLTLADANLTTGVGWTGLHGTTACRGSIKGNRLSWLEGHAAFAVANMLEQPIRQLHAQFLVDSETPEVLEVRGLSGDMFNGRVVGEGRVTFGSGLDYAMDLKALNIQLEEFGRHNRFGEGRLAGRATAMMYLTGKGAGLDELSGRADIDVPQGRLYKLPIVLELFKAVSLNRFDGVAFDEAHASIKVDGRRLSVERLSLLGSAVSLGGKGSLDLDGSNVDLDFYAVWARIAQVLPTAWRDVPASVSQNLLKIRMGGSLAQPKFEPEPVPMIVEPVKQLMDRVQSRAKAAAP